VSGGEDLQQPEEQPEEQPTTTRRTGVAERYLATLGDEEVAAAGRRLRESVLGPDLSEMRQLIAGPSTTRVLQGALETISEAMRQTIGETSINAQMRETMTTVVDGMRRSAVPKLDVNVTLPAIQGLAAMAASSGIQTQLGNVDGILSNWAKTMPTYWTRLATPGFTESIRRMLERLQPRNLRGIKGLDTDKIDQVMAEEGIPFFLVPDADTALALLAAPDAVGRRTILKERAEPVFDACEEILALCVDPGLPFLGSTIRGAIAAYRDGHHQAAQALATNVLDSTLQEFGSETHRQGVVGSGVKGRGRGIAYVQDLPLSEWFALAPLVAVHEKDDRPNPPRVMYSRKSTSHRVTREQYTPANAVQAIMLSTSLLGFVQRLW
jgi:hypothetical protein